MTRSVALDTLLQVVCLSFKDFLIYYTFLMVQGLKDCLDLERTIHWAVFYLNQELKFILKSFLTRRYICVNL